MTELLLILGIGLVCFWIGFLTARVQRDAKEILSKR